MLQTFFRVLHGIWFLVIVVMLLLFFSLFVRVGAVAILAVIFGFIPMIVQECFTDPWFALSIGVAAFFVWAYLQGDQLGSTSEIRRGRSITRLAPQRPRSTKVFGSARDRSSAWQARPAFRKPAKRPLLNLKSSLRKRRK